MNLDNAAQELELIEQGMRRIVTQAERAPLIMSVIIVWGQLRGLDNMVLEIFSGFAAVQANQPVTATVEIAGNHHTLLFEYEPWGVTRVPDAAKASMN